MARLPPGSYTLDRDVANPHPRPRTKTDWTLAAVWKAGTLFVVTPRSADRPRGPVVIYQVKKQNAWLDESDFPHGRPEQRAQFKALSVALVPVAENLDTVFARLSVDSYDLAAFLRHLVETKVMTLKQFEQLFRAWR